MHRFYLGLFALYGVIALAIAVVAAFAQPTGTNTVPPIQIVGGVLTFPSPVTQVGFPVGAQALPSIYFSADTTFGWYRNAANNWTLASGGNTNEISLLAGLLRTKSTEAWCWSSTADSTGSCDTGVSRDSAGVVDLGTGAQGNTGGTLQAAHGTFNALTTGTNADFVCLSATGVLLIQTTACTISSLRFKPDWKAYSDDALAKVAKFDVGTFHLKIGKNSDPNAESLQAGLSAENIAAIAPECAIYEDDMITPKSYRQECILALLVKAIQEMKTK